MRSRICEKLVRMLRRFKRYGLSHHENQCKRGFLLYSLAISVKYVFAKTTEGFVEAKEKFIPYKFACVCVKRRAPCGGAYSGFTRWDGGSVRLWHFGPEMISVLHQYTCTNVMVFEAKARVFQRPHLVSFKWLRRLKCFIQLQKSRSEGLLIRRASSWRCNGPQFLWAGLLRSFCSLRLYSNDEIWFPSGGSGHSLIVELVDWFVVLPHGVMGKWWWTFEMLLKELFDAAVLLMKTCRLDFILLLTPCYSINYKE